MVAGFIASIKPLTGGAANYQMENREAMAAECADLA
jgi:hypothetical protein